MIHLIAGPDHFLAERRVREICLAADPEGMSTTRLDKSASLNDVIGAISTMGFFGSGRVVIADGFMAAASGVGKAKKAEADELGNLFSSVAPGNTLILVDVALHSVPAAIRKLAPEDAESFAGTPPRGQVLVAHVEDEIRQEGGRIERRAINRLLDLLFPGEWQAPNRNPQYDRPPDMLSLSSEIAKLVTAANGAEITMALVDNLVRRETQEQLFPAIDGVAAGNVRAALSALGDLGGDESIASQVINQLVANAEIAPIAIGLRGDAEMKSVGDQIGQTAKRMSMMQRNYSAAQAAILADVVLESDRRLKTGVTRNPAGQLHEILIQRANKTRGQ